MNQNTQQTAHILVVEDEAHIRRQAMAGGCRRGHKDIVGLFPRLCL